MNIGIRCPLVVKNTHTYIVYNWWMHICLCPSHKHTAYPVKHMHQNGPVSSQESVGIVKRSDNLFIMASESIIIKSWEALTFRYYFFRIFFFSFFIERFSCLLFLWLVSRCHFLFILNCLLLLLNNVFFYFRSFISNDRIMFNKEADTAAIHCARR